MKPYFAKYRTVKGDIKVGDYFQDRELGICKRLDDGVHSSWVEWKGGKTNISITPDHKLVKLFGCARDVAVGDTFDSENGTGFICSRVDSNKIYSIGGLNSDIEEVAHDKYYCYKVIQQLSPDATWVKSGDEFDLGEVSAVYGATMHDIRMVKVKCPTCKTFH